MNLNEAFDGSELPQESNLNTTLSHQRKCGELTMRSDNVVVLCFIPSTLAITPLHFLA